MLISIKKRRIKLTLVYYAICILSFYFIQSNSAKRINITTKHWLKSEKLSAIQQIIGRAKAFSEKNSSFYNFQLLSAYNLLRAIETGENKEIDFSRFMRNVGVCHQFMDFNINGALIALDKEGFEDTGKASILSYLNLKKYQLDSIENIAICLSNNLRYDSLLDLYLDIVHLKENSTSFKRNYTSLVKYISGNDKYFTSFSFADWILLTKEKDKFNSSTFYMPLNQEFNSTLHDNNHSKLHLRDQIEYEYGIYGNLDSFIIKKQKELISISEELATESENGSITQSIGGQFSIASFNINSDYIYWIIPALIMMSSIYLLNLDYLLSRDKKNIDRFWLSDQLLYKRDIAYGVYIYNIFFILEFFIKSLPFYLLSWGVFDQFGQANPFYSMADPILVSRNTNLENVLLFDTFITISFTTVLLCDGMYTDKKIVFKKCRSAFSNRFIYITALTLWFLLPALLLFFYLTTKNVQISTILNTYNICYFLFTYMILSSLFFISRKKTILNSFGLLIYLSFLYILIHSIIQLNYFKYLDI